MLPVLAHRVGLRVGGLRLGLDGDSCSESESDSGSEAEVSMAAHELYADAKTGTAFDADALPLTALSSLRLLEAARELNRDGEAAGGPPSSRTPARDGVKMKMKIGMHTTEPGASAHAPRGSNLVAAPSNAPAPGVPPPVPSIAEVARDEDEDEDTHQDEDKGKDEGNSPSLLHNRGAGAGGHIQPSPVGPPPVPARP